MIFAALFLGCRPHLTMEVTRPAQVMIDPAVVSLSVVDRVGSDLSGEVVAAFQESAKEARVARYSLLDGQRIYTTQTNQIGAPLNRESARAICADQGTTGILSLEALTTDGEWFITEEIRKVTETQTVTENGVSTEQEIEKDVPIYAATYTAQVDAQWRLYNCVGRSLDDLSMVLSESWFAEGDSQGDARSAVGETAEKQEWLVGAAGTTYFQRIAPYEVTLSRTYYRWGSKPLRVGVRALKSGDWQTAESQFREASKQTENRRKGKAHYNLALAKEQSGDLDAAHKQASRAHALIDSDMSKAYVRALRKRQKQEVKLQEQTQGAPDEPRQR